MPALEKPSLIVLAGPPCSGKSTVGEQLARRLEIPCLSMDGTRQRILPGAAHTRADREVAYRAMHLAAECVLRAEGSMILDAPYGHEEDRRELASLVDAARGRLFLVEFRVSPETAAKRLRQRGPDANRPDLTETIVTEAARTYPYSESGLLLDTDVLNVAEAVEHICAWMGNRVTPSGL